MSEDMTPNYEHLRIRMTLFTTFSHFRVGSREGLTVLKSALVLVIGEIEFGFQERISHNAQI